MIRTLFYLFIIGFIFLCGIVQYNRFLDPSSPVPETIVVNGKGTRFQVVMVHYLIGRSEVLNREIQVDVLSDVAEVIEMGSSIDVVIGQGLLGKNWIDTVEDYKEYESVGFKLLYLGIFTVMFLYLSVTYFRMQMSLNIRQRIVFYMIGIAISFAVFYVI